MLMVHSHVTILFHFPWREIDHIDGFMLPESNTHFRAFEIAMASEVVVKSHKRTISSTTLDTEPPKSKLRVDDASHLPQSTSLPKYVYVVVLTPSDIPSGEGSEVRGVFCSIEDANNAIRGIVADEFTNAELCSRDTTFDGRVSWASQDVGEGGAANLHIEKHQVHGPGQYPTRDWPSEMEWDKKSDISAGDEDDDEEEDEEDDDDDDDDDDEDEEDHSHGSDDGDKE
jgi:hypothetical protein